MNRWVLVLRGACLLTLLLLSISGRPAQAADQPPCSCSPQDRTDIESRIKQVEAAIKEYDALIKEWERKEQGGGEPLNLTPEFRRSVQGSVGFRMSATRNSKARAYGAETDATCNITVDPNATVCLRPALLDHESVHQKVCNDNKSLNPFSDFRSSQRVVDYMKEEQAGYRKESARLQEELDQIKKRCKPTQPDRSTLMMQQQLEAQQQRINEANSRLQSYGKTLGP